MLRDIMGLKDFDLYDILAEIGFGVAPKSRRDRVFALEYKYNEWLNGLPPNTRNTLLALAKQFEIGGTEELENHYIFRFQRFPKLEGLKHLRCLAIQRM